MRLTTTTLVAMASVLCLCSVGGSATAVTSAVGSAAHAQADVNSTPPRAPREQCAVIVDVGDRVSGSSRDLLTSGDQQGATNVTGRVQAAPFVCADGGRRDGAHGRYWPRPHDRP